MYKTTLQLLFYYSTRSKELKDSIAGTAKSVAGDAKSVASTAKNVIQDDFRAIAQSVANASGAVDQSVRGTSQERFREAEEAARRAETEDRTFVFSESAENTVNKALKMGSEAKDAVKDATRKAKDSAAQSFESSK